MSNFNLAVNSPISATWKTKWKNGVVNTGSWNGTAETYREKGIATLAKQKPGWRKLKVKPDLSYSASYWETVNPIASWTNRDEYTDRSEHHSASQDVRSYGGNLSPVFSADISVVTAESSNKLLQKLNTAKASTLTSAAEFDKTAQMVAGNAKRIVEALRALRRFDAVGLSKALGITTTHRQVKRMSRLKTRWELNSGETDLISRGRKITYREQFERTIYKPRSCYKDFFGNAWLEYSYGWKPLLSDIHSHAEAAANIMLERQNIVLVESATAERKWARVRRTNQNESRYNADKTSIEARVTTKVRFTRENLGALQILGLTNPLLVAWELVPFSFVVDWFLPIGNAIENMSATDGLTFHSGYVSTKVIEETESIVRSYDGPISYNGGQRFPSGSGIARTKNVRFSRDLLNSFPKPALPSFKDPRSFSHAGSAIALLNSLFLSRK